MSLPTLDDKICKRLDWPINKVRDHIIYEQREGKLIVKERVWITPRNDKKKLDAFLVGELKAERLPSERAKARWMLDGRKAGASEPERSGKEDTKEHINPPLPQPAQTPNKNESYNLGASANLFPMLMSARPVIDDQKGVTIDGWNRLQANRKWPRVTVNMENENQRKIARFILNFCRRNVTDKEKRDFLVALAVETGWSPQEMDKNLPMSYSWIMKYLPDEYKEKAKAEAGAVGGMASGASRREAKDDFGRPIIFHCGFPECKRTMYEPTYYMNVPICPYHNEAIQKEPSLIKKLERKPLPTPKVEKKTYESIFLKPTWAERKELMHPRESKMDWHTFLSSKVNEELCKDGWEFTPWKHYVLLEISSDLTAINRELKREVIFFNDHPKTHKNPAKDEFLRGLLEGRLIEGRRVTVVGLLYPDNTEQSKREMNAQIVAELKGGAELGEAK